MNQVKLWHTFGIIIGYLCLVALLACGVGALRAYSVPWGVPFGIGCGIWVAAILCLTQREKRRIFGILPLPMSATSCGLFVGAFILGKHLHIDINQLLVLALLVAACYLLLMLLLTITPLKDRIWYQIICFLVWLGASVTAMIFACNALFSDMQERGMFLLFFLLLLGFLAAGSLIETEDFLALWHMLIVPAFIATGIVGILVLLAVSGGDGCDGCDCGDCHDGCSCEGGKHDGTGYTKKQKSVTTMDSISRGDVRP